jgi:hypothetical protein
VRGSVFPLATVRVLSWQMIRFPAVVVGLRAPIANHGFRSTGITPYASDTGSIASSDISARHVAQGTRKVQASPIHELITSTAG